MKRTPLVVIFLIVGSAFSTTLPINPQAAAAEPPPREPDLINSIGMKFMRLPAGTFVMGSPPEHRPSHDNAAEEGPQHEVEISRPFYCGVYEVTQAEYRQVTGSNPAFHRADNPLAFEPRSKPKTTNNFPVEWVNWHAAVDFCRKLSELPEEKKARRTYRLPTEAEWEYACRAGTTTRFSFGDECNGTECRCDGRFPVGSKPKGNQVWEPLSVGSFPPNAWGLYDMHGNVDEWCADWYAFDYYTRSPRKDPPGPAAGTDRIRRGGYYCAFPDYFVGSANRLRSKPSELGYFTGFRVVMTRE
ncbi:MAG: SUMF1/EgtB/PvdO family nonheme iron enzyme [Planctomycetaceae bacterium]|nr:SUMF1/EgtB/PvdO family nonheme iron enzyme [Planctomycetaceae bacterium]